MGSYLSQEQGPAWGAARLWALSQSNLDLSPQLHHARALGPWASDTTSWKLGLLLCKVGVVVPPAQGDHEDYVAKYLRGAWLGLDDELQKLLSPFPNQEVPQQQGPRGSDPGQGKSITGPQGTTSAVGRGGCTAEFHAAGSSQDSMA